MLLYAITSRALLAGDEAERAGKLVALASRWSAEGVDFLQIRENDLPAVELIRLAAAIVRAVREGGGHTRVLLNAGAASGLNIAPNIALDIAIDTALEVGVDGLHLPGGLTPEQMESRVEEIREAWRARRPEQEMPPVSVSCHSLEEVNAARAAGATLALFAPVFEKILPGGSALAGRGLESLAEACRTARQPGNKPPLPLFALGGVTLENAPRCLAAGAAGIAAIRLFLEATSGGGLRRSTTLG